MKTTLRLPNSPLVEDGVMPLPPAAKPVKSRVRMIAVLVLCALLLVGFAVLCAAVLPAIQSMLETHSRFTDASYSRMIAALQRRWDPDDSITAAYVGFDFNAVGGQPVESWLTIELEYAGSCDANAPADPCRQLADELARIVFDTYAHVDELMGIHISMTRSASVGPVSLSITPLDMALSIAQWRQELGLSR